MTTVRPAAPGDAAQLHEVSQEAILRSAAGHYEPGPLQAWAGRRSVAGHERMVERTTVYVAEDAGRIAGFVAVALEPGHGLVAGEVDQLFVRPEAGGRGIARLLLTEAERAARAAGLTELGTHASWRAVPVFERHGFTRLETETVRVGDHELTRARMRKPL